jgi:small GTP-binding protein
MRHEARNPYKKGKGLMAEQKYEKAIKRFEEAISLDPKYREAYNEIGRALLALNDVNGAMRYFTLATIVDHDYVDAWANRETAELVKGNYEQAAKCLDEIIRIKPEDKDVLLRKGRLMMHQDKPVDAVECFNRMLEIAPGYKSVLTDEEKKLLTKFKAFLPKEVLKLSKKICVLGDPAVGKTSLIRKYVYDVFDDRYISTIGTKVTKKVLRLKNTKAKEVELTLLIWDIAGEKKFRDVRSVYYSGANAAFIVSDTSRMETLNSIIDWKESLFKVTSKIPMVCIGNKIDLTSEFGKDDCGGIASSLNAPYFLTSAKTGESVENAFSALCNRLIKG